MGGEDIGKGGELGKFLFYNRHPELIVPARAGGRERSAPLGRLIGSAWGGRRWSANQLWWPGLPPPWLIAGNHSPPQAWAPYPFTWKIVNNYDLVVSLNPLLCVFLPHRFHFFLRWSLTSACLAWMDGCLLASVCFSLWLAFTLLFCLFYLSVSLLRSLTSSWSVNLLYNSDCEWCWFYDFFSGSRLSD